MNIYIVKDESNVLGFAGTCFIDRDVIELSGIIMLESATGEGFGTQVIENAVSSARWVRAQRMVVKTEAVNERAIGFYKKMGVYRSG